MAFVWTTIRRMTKWTFKPVPFVVGSGLGVWMAKEQLDLLRAREQKIMQALSGSSAPAPIVARPRYQVGVWSRVVRGLAGRRVSL